MDPERVERTLDFLLRQQVEFAGDLQQLQTVMLDLRDQVGQLAARLGDLTGLVQSLAQLQMEMLRRQAEMREEMDRRFAETDRRMAETDERIRRLAALIEQGFHRGNGSRP